MTYIQYSIITVGLIIITRHVIHDIYTMSNYNSEIISDTCLCLYYYKLA